VTIAPQRALRRLGAGPAVFPLGLGCMGMSDFYGPADERESIATIHAALDAGITLLDTGDYYASGHNELLIARALKDRPGRALLSVKFGALRGPDGAWLGIDLRPATVKNAIAYSLRRLGVSRIDIYRPGRLDPTVPIEDTNRRPRRIGEGRLCRRDRIVGSRRRCGAARARRPPARRPSDRVLADQPRA
jgi:aryl-alcohol dehydrogenase-like predicted oxidoreductase